VVYGLLVGVFFALMEMIGAAAMGAPPLSPWRAFASTVLGRAALDRTPLAIALIVGIIAHFTLSAIYGGVYAVGNQRLSQETRRSWGREAALGLIFGILLYVINFQVFARILYPWFRQANQPWQFVLHTLFFGLPLALLFTADARRMQRGMAPLPA
jgi:hypothetical protein